MIHRTLTPAVFAPLKTQIDQQMPSTVQAIAIAWTAPWSVGCNSITSAVTRGYDPVLCEVTPACGFGTASPYYNSNSHAPFTDYGMRISMLLAGDTIDDVKALIDREVASDHT